VSLSELSWPAEALPEAIAVAARRAGLAPRSIERPVGPAALTNVEDIATWIEAIGGALGLETEHVHAHYAEAEELLLAAAPAVFLFPVDQGGYRQLVAQRAIRGTLVLIAPDGSAHRVPVRTVARLLYGSVETPVLGELEKLLDVAGVVGRRRERARTAMLEEQLAGRIMRGCWIVRLPARASFMTQLTSARMPRRFAALVFAYLVQHLLWIGSWWVLGKGALEGRLDPGWLAAWALLLLAAVPFRLLATWSQGVVSIGVGAVLKRRLLSGALRLAPEEIRLQGAGQLLGRVIESEAVEALALSGGFLSVFSVIELAVAAWVLAAGAVAVVHLVVLTLAIVVCLALGWRYYQLTRRWTNERLDLTNDLVEGMVGHRTRMAQQAPSRWHQGEDQGLERYLASSQQMDSSAVLLVAVVPRAWMVLGVAALAAVFVSGKAGLGALAVSLGGVLLGHQALTRLLTGLLHLTGAAIAWQQVQLLFEAGARSELPGSPEASTALLKSEIADGETVVDARQLVFRYRPQGGAVLAGCSVRVCAGDRILIEGPSGGGKSTLASLLVGLRQPESGLLLLRGLDVATVGEEQWGRRVVAAPQFHENHVLAETFAFNLLMGRQWPAAPGDLAEAERLCHELGLGELLERMPAGLLQMVGETGWQLSHGERSRLFIARALLQGADLVILDESFAALDPENLQRALECALKRARTLIVIAHP
jgi:ATP-binding cassette subfamily B protein